MTNTFHKHYPVCINAISEVPHPKKLLPIDSMWKSDRSFCNKILCKVMTNYDFYFVQWSWGAEMSLSYLYISVANSLEYYCRLPFLPKKKLSRPSNGTFFQIRCWISIDLMQTWNPRTAVMDIVHIKPSLDSGLRHSFANISTVYLHKWFSESKTNSLDNWKCSSQASAALSQASTLFSATIRCRG